MRQHGGFEEDEQPMFIDIHAHAYKHAMPPHNGRVSFCTPDQVIRRYDELDIEKGALLPLIGPEVYLPQSNEEILEICEAHPQRFVAFCNIDPRGMTNDSHAPLHIWMEHYKERGCIGLGEIMPNLPFLDPRVQNLFAQAADVGMPLTFDISTSIGGTYGLYDDPGLPQLEQSLARHPKLTILGHGPAFWAEIGRLRTPADRAGYPPYPVEGEGVVPVLFRRYANLWGDLSANSGFNALNRDEGYAAHFINEFQDRLLFGTDICRPDQDLPLAGFLRRLRDEGRISESVFTKVAHENARRLFGL